jgi:hypothetical protein
MNHLISGTKKSPTLSIAATYAPKLSSPRDYLSKENETNNKQGTTKQ